MWKLAAILYLLVGPTIAGVAVLVGLAAPDLGLDDMRGVAILGLGGRVAGVPAAWILAAKMNGAGRRDSAS